MAQTYIGQPLTRKEDFRFLTGRGTYTDDVKQQHLLHASILRSPHAHARITSIDTSRALQIPGVVAVFTAQDIADAVEPRPIPIRLVPMEGLERFLQYPLAIDHKVRHVGEPVAVIVAGSRYLAEDGADAVDVRYEPLPVVVEMEDSMKDEVLLHEQHGTNTAADYMMELGDADAAFVEAEYTRKETFVSHRHTGNPMETRGLVASYDVGRDEMTVWGETKVPHFNRGVLADLLQMAEHRIHFIEGDVGGGFGITGEFYPEDFLIPFASKQLRRPIKWIEDRREHLVSANQSREHTCELEIAAKRDGTITAFRATISGNIGAYVRTHGALVTSGVASIMMGPYNVPNFKWRTLCLLTNKTGMGTYRAPGRYESCFYRERMVDIMCQDLGLDPVEVRYKNLIQPEQMPYTMGITRPDHDPIVYDSGNYPAGLDTVLESINYDGIKHLQGQFIDGKWHGIGIGCFVKNTGTGPMFEGARVVVTGPNQIAVYLGLTVLGQGHETAMAQICAQGMGVPLEWVTVYHGDTDMMTYGGGTFASRGTFMGGNALYKAAQEMNEKVVRLAAGYLDVDPTELEFSNGQVLRKGSTTEGPLLDLGQVLELAGPASRYNQGEMGLDHTAYFHASKLPYAYGSHATHITVDPETGMIDILDYVVVEDVGHVINPLMVKGQVWGAAAQGIGATLLEHLAYDENGQPLATTFLDYPVTSSMDMPNVQAVDIDLAPSPTNPLGVKGAGEGGIVATAAVLGNALSHALHTYGVQVRDLPLSPSRVREMMQGK